MVKTQIRLSEEVKADLEALSEATGKSQQAIMRDAITKYLKRKPAQIAVGNKIIAARDELRGNT